MGDTIGGWLLAKGADDKARTALARFYAMQVLKPALSLADVIEAGAADLQEPDVFGG